MIARLALLIALMPMTLTALAADNMPDHIRRFQADLGSLERKFPIRLSETRAARMESFFNSELKALKKVDFDKLDREGQIDYILLRHHLENRLLQGKIDKASRAQIQQVIPFGKEIIDLDERLRADMLPVDPKAAANQLDGLLAKVTEAQKDAEKLELSQATTMRAAAAVDSLRDVLGHWYKFYSGYDPMFTWWCEAPYKALEPAMRKYSAHLRQEIAKIAEGDTETIVGDPIGREALLADLESELIDYSPDELVEIANKEFVWCETEMKKAAAELGFKDWKKALEHVKNLYVAPGDQPKLIKEMALEAIDFLEKRDLLTIPELAKETWRMEMMSPEAQKQSPFFLGGEAIIVSYPTHTMDHDSKLMSLRGNNPHFSRATVQHELIPGHHLQQFYQSRYNQHRDLFGTPFWVEGWALYWEFTLWDMGFPRGPEDRIGMLFWRMHRCARIIFSLGFHLGKMTPAECVDFLVDRVGHERNNATAEVRRSFAGNYPPLYQAAYMLGALQLRTLRKELVETGKMKEKTFHDSILIGNEMPIGMIRARLYGEKLTPDYRPKWRFYAGLK